MEENKIEENKKSNVGLVIFLILIILGLAGYICYDKFFVKKEIVKCVSNNTDGDSSATKDETSNILSDSDALKIVSEIYEKAYSALNGDINTMEETTLWGDVYYRMDLDSIRPYFSDRAMAKFEYEFVKKDGEYYDIYNDGGGKDSYLERLIIHRTIFGGTDQGLRKLSIVDITEATIRAYGELEEHPEISPDPYPLSITFIKENGNWVIDSFD